MKTMIAVALGGALGSVIRYVVTAWAGNRLGLDFPWGTLIVNLAGSFAIGVLAETMEVVWSPSPEIRAFLIVGILGGFTTYSAFSLDIYMLIERGAWMPASTYVLASLILGLGGLVAGLRIVRVAAG